MPRLSALENNNSSRINIMSLAVPETTRTGIPFDAKRDLDQGMIAGYTLKLEECLAEIDVEKEWYEDYIWLASHLKLLFPGKNWTQGMEPEHYADLTSAIKETDDFFETQEFFSGIKILFPDLLQYANQDELAKTITNIDDSFGDMSDAEGEADWQDFCIDTVACTILLPIFSSRGKMPGAKRNLLGALEEARQVKSVWGFTPMMAAARLLYGVTIDPTEDEWQLMHEQLRSYAQPNKLPIQYLRFALWMKVIAANSVAITDKGIEFDGAEDQTGESHSSIPPVVRNF